MKSIVITLFSISLVLFSCQSKKEVKRDLTPGNHKVTVTEVLNAQAYTYLNVTEEGNTFWIAVPTIEAQMGEELYFSQFMEMVQFESKDLNRVFESVLFVSDISKEPIANAPHQAMSMGKPSAVKKEISLEPVQGGITIQELFANKEKYNGQTIAIKGQVVKVNYGIMDKNWFHIQDGTEHNGQFDVTITSLAEDVEVGDQLVFQGTVSLNKDFGAGYAYDVILEDAVLK